jgi:membrane dipeptidase
LLSVRRLFKTLLGSRTQLRWSTVAGPLAFAVALGAFVALAPTLVDVGLNNIHRVPSPAISSRAHDLHRRAFVVDMHADTLLWPKRDFFRRNDWAHVDLPRLQEGNVALQIFTIVTSVPYGQSIESNYAPTNPIIDKLTPKIAAEGWGWEAVKSNAGRALIQTRNMHDLAKRSNGTLVVVRDRAELQTFIKAREADKSKVAAVLGIEGLHALDGNITNVDVLYDAGVRMMGLAHFFDNDLSGSAHGKEKGGLTAFGRDVVARMEQKKIFVDVAHASQRSILELLTIATRPILSSHTGVRGVCDNQRNLGDEEIKGIAKSGGVLGVAYFRPAVCGETELEGIINTISYIKNLVGVEHVGLGSDFDGAVTTPFDTSQLVQITNGLLQAGFTPDEVLLVMGGNMRRVLLEHLP